MRCQDDINTELNMKSIGRAAVAQWTKRLTRKRQTRVQIREAHIFGSRIDSGDTINTLYLEREGLKLNTGREYQARVNLPLEKIKSTRKLISNAGSFTRCFR